MRFRTFAWIAILVAVIAGNTALVLWLRGGRARAGPRGPDASVVVPRPAPEVSATLVPGGTVGCGPGNRIALRVSVVDGSGAPVPGARVTVRGDRAGAWSPFPEDALGEAATDAGGVVEFPLPRRVAVVLRVEAEGFARAEVPARSPEASVVLVGESALRIRAVDDASGAPVPGVPIRIRAVQAPFAPRPPLEAAGETGTDGDWVFRGLPAGDWDLLARSEDRPAKTMRASTAAGGEAAVEIRLRRGFELRGRVVLSGTQVPVTGGRISYAPERPAVRRIPLQPSPSAALDAEGRFVLRGLAALPKSSALFRVETGGGVVHAQGQTPTVDPATGEQSGEIQVAIPGNNPDGAFTGTVTGEDGRPVDGALVLMGGTLPSEVARWMRGEGFLDEGWTDASGRFRIVPQQTVWMVGRILVLHPEYAPALIEVPSRMRRRSFDVVLRSGAQVVVTVRSGGAPAAGAVVVAQLRHSHPQRSLMEFGDVHGALRAGPVTDGEGRAVLEHLGEGPWFLEVRGADGREGARVQFDVPSGASEYQVAVDLKPLRPVLGTVRVRGGSLPTGAAVLLPGSSVGDWLRVPVDASGRFESPPMLVPASLTVDGRIPVWEPEIFGPGRLLGLAEPGVPVEIEVDPPPEQPQAR